MKPTSEIRIGVSACLLGERVRHDSGHKRDRYLTDTLAPFVTFVPVCPEVEMGLETPRDSMRLVRAADDEPRLVVQKDGTDLTERMNAFARARVEGLAALDLSGYVLKKDSPSCGMERVRLYDRNGSPSRNGVGLFARALMERWPHLPVEEEGRLHDARLRESFVERVFAYRRVADLFANGWTAGDLVRFHTAEKLLLFAHDEALYRDLGRLVARAKELESEELAESYRTLFLRALARPASVRRHTNVLQHAAGHFKDLLDSAARASLAAVIEDYRCGLVPLVVPLTLIRHFVRTLDVAYLAGQTYLEPHPKELMLRNHV